MGSAGPATLSLIMPAYNEQALVEQAVRSVVRDLRAARLGFELVIVNDGSQDATGRIADALMREFTEIRVVHHQVNEGLGGAVRTGIRSARYDWLIVCPVDSPLTGEQVQRYVSATKEADVVIGCRPDRPGYSWWMRVGSRSYNAALRWLFGVQVNDFNWIHLYPRAMFNNISIESRGIGYEAEVLIKAWDKGYRIKEVHSEMQPRTRGVPSVRRPRVIARAMLEVGRLWWRLRLRPALDVAGDRLGNRRRGA